MATKTIQEVIQNNSWESVDFLESTDVNRMLAEGIVTGAGKKAKAMINAVDQTNVQSTITTGLSDFPWAEQNFGDASQDHATPLQQFFEDIVAKTFYGNMWWEVMNIQNDLLSESDPEGLVRNKVGEYWAIMWNKLIAATVCGMADISAITIGDGTDNFSGTMVNDARNLKGDMGYGSLSTMYMHSNTLHDILAKQIAGTITPPLITEYQGPIVLVPTGAEVSVQTNQTKYVYNGSTPIIIDDAMVATSTTGIISMIEQGAFAFAQKDLTSPLAYNNDPTAGNGAGLEQWGTKNIYMLHPIGFSFVGVHGTGAGEYDSKSGLSIAELRGGGMYELVVDAKLAMITNLNVKIGA